jgi:hypothetical protein
MTAPTYFLDGTAVTARNAEYATDVFDDADGDGTYADPYLGMNRAGSNAPGLGINVSVTPTESDGAVSVNDWTLEDQHEAARVPQDGAHLGNTGLGAGTAGVGTVPFNIADRTDGTDNNNTCTLTVLANGWINTVVA